MGEWKNFENRAVAGRAIRLNREIADFEDRWPKTETGAGLTISFTWDQLERQLVDLAATPEQASMARHLVSGSRKLAAFKPPEMVLREILCLTWVLLDENFRAEPEEGSAKMT